jgi:hypothetical protein
MAGVCVVDLRIPSSSGMWGLLARGKADLRPQNPAAADEIRAMLAADQADQPAHALSAPSQAAQSAPPASQAGDNAPHAPADQGAAPTASPDEVLGPAKCETCSTRTYQDASDDPSVSFQSATHISPEAAPAAVRSHEQEHVVNERNSARREGKEVAYQHVQIHTCSCPECGRVYVSGGTTTTAVRSKSNQSSAAARAYGSAGNAPDAPPSTDTLA